MRYALLLSLSLIGCASPHEIRMTARAHELRAIQYEARGDYYRGARERRAATKQYEKAARRAEYPSRYYW